MDCKRTRVCVEQYGYEMAHNMRCHAEGGGVMLFGQMTQEPIWWCECAMLFGQMAQEPMCSSEFVMLFGQMAEEPMCSTVHLMPGWIRTKLFDRKQNMLVLTCSLVGEQLFNCKQNVC